jgi:hypothetical protein
LGRSRKVVEIFLTITPYLYKLVVARRDDVAIARRQSGLAKFAIAALRSQGQGGEKY